MQMATISRPHRSIVWRQQAGLSLVELMVGAFIGIIALLVVSNAFIFSSAQKKTTSSGTDAQTVGVLAATMLERDIRMAGFGLSLPMDAGTAFCEIDAYDSSYTAGSNEQARYFSLSMAPMQIIDGGANASDVLTVFYGNADRHMVTESSSLSANVPVGTTSFTLVNPFGFGPGDLVLIVPRATASSPNQLGSSSGHDSRPDCAMLENVSTAIDTSISTVQGSYSFARGGATVNTTSFYNPPASAPGSRIAFEGGNSAGAVVVNLGKRPGRNVSGNASCDLGNCPVNRSYGIDLSNLVNPQLVMTDNLVAVGKRVSMPVAEGVVFLKVQFGKDTNNDGLIDLWDKTLSDGVTDTTGDGVVNQNDALWAQWRMVRAVRFAVVARAQQRESTLVSDAALTLWPNDGAQGEVKYTLPSEDARHYRYRVYQTVVPVRNSLWRP